MDPLRLAVQIIVSCHVGARNPGPLERQPVLLAAESHFQSKESLFCLLCEIALAVAHGHNSPAWFPLSTKIGKAHKNVGYFAKNVKNLWS